MSNDQAARIAESFYPEGTMDHAMQRSKMEKRIRQATATSVRKERERCVGIVVKAEANARDGGESEMCDDIIEKINGGKR